MLKDILAFKWKLKNKLFPNTVSKNSVPFY